MSFNNCTFSGMFYFENCQFTIINEGSNLLSSYQPFHDFAFYNSNVGEQGMDRSTAIPMPWIWPSPQPAERMAASLLEIEAPLLENEIHLEAESEDMDIGVPLTGSEALPFAIEAPLLEDETKEALVEHEGLPLEANNPRGEAMPAKKEKAMNGEDDFPEDFLEPSPTMERNSLSRQRESFAKINETIEEMVRPIDVMSTMSMDTIDRHTEVLQNDERDGHGSGDILEPVGRQEAEQKDNAEDDKEETSDENADDDSQRDEEEIIENGEAPSAPPNSPLPGPSRKRSATPTPHQGAKKPRSNVGRPRKPSAIQIAPKGILDLEYNSMGNKGIWFVVKMVDGTIELKKGAELAAYSAQIISMLKKKLYAEKKKPKPDSRFVHHLEATLMNYLSSKK